MPSWKCNQTTNIAAVGLMWRATAPGDIFILAHSGFGIFHEIHGVQVLLIIFITL